VSQGRARRQPQASDNGCELSIESIARAVESIQPKEAQSMQIGAVYPQIELRGDPSAVRQVGLAVERLGFDYLLAYDHVLGAVHADRTPPLTGPYTEHDPFHDPFVMFAYLAGITERLKFATGILILPQRPTALVARQAADLDLLSGGRLRLGVGIGWNHVEYEALGQQFGTRGARQEEQIGLLRRLFTEPVVDFTGRFDRIDRAALVPRPAHPIPIWLGGSSEAAYDRAARLADGFIFMGSDIDRTIDTWNRLRDRVNRVGRPVDEFAAEYVVRPQGPPGDLTAKIDAWREAGGTHLSVITMGLGLDSAEGHIDYLASVADALSLEGAVDR
jgi:probable F420-dependent oxidoreductase